MPDPQFPLSTSIRLDWSELDAFGHINNVAYFRYLQTSRIAYWEAIGLSVAGGAMGIGPMLAATRCDYKAQLHYPGSITVQASVTEIGNTSFRLRHLILNEEGALCAEGFDVVVLYDFGAGSKATVPDELRKKVESLEGRGF